MLVNACVFLERQNLPLIIGGSRKGAQHYVSKMYENGTNIRNWIEFRCLHSRKILQICKG